MKKDEPPIPVRSVVCLPRWLMVGSVTLCSVLAAGCIALVVIGALQSEASRRWGLIGGGLGGLLGCLGGLYGTLNDWHRRLPAPALLWHIKVDAPLPFYRRVFWPALAVFTVGVVLGTIWPHRAIWHGVVQPSGLLAFLSGGMECIRRHTTAQARALFALYADGALAAEDAAAIDDARRKDAKFDAEVRAFQELAARIARVANDVS